MRQGSARYLAAAQRARRSDRAPPPRWLTRTTSDRCDARVTAGCDDVAMQDERDCMPACMHTCTSLMYLCNNELSLLRPSSTPTFPPPSPSRYTNLHPSPPPSPPLSSSPAPTSPFQIYLHPSASPRPYHFPPPLPTHPSTATPPLHLSATAMSVVRQFQGRHPLLRVQSSLHAPTPAARPPRTFVSFVFPSLFPACVRGNDRRVEVVIFEYACTALSFKRSFLFAGLARLGDWMD